MSALRRPLLCAALLLTLALPAQAQGDTPEARRAAAQSLVKSMDQLMGPDRMLATMRASMQAPIVQGIRSNPRLTPAQQQRAADVMVKTVVDATAELMKELMPGVYAAVTEVYVERFTVSEIQAVQAFYDSPAGRKSVTVMMDDMPRLMQPMVQSLQSRMPALQQRIQAAVQQLKAEGIDLEPPKRP